MDENGYQRLGLVLLDPGAVASLPRPVLLPVGDLSVIAGYGPIVDNLEVPRAFLEGYFDLYVTKEGGIDEAAGARASLSYGDKFVPVAEVAFSACLDDLVAQILSGEAGKKMDILVGHQIKVGPTGKKEVETSLARIDSGVAMTKEVEDLRTLLEDSRSENLRQSLLF